MSEENKNKEETGTEETGTETGTQTQTENSAVELEAIKELMLEQKKQMEAVIKENKELKVANAKLAITQSITKQESPEEILNKMFK